MDPFSLTLGIISLVQAASTLVIQLRKISKDVSESTADVAKLSGELESLAHVLERLGEIEAAHPAEMMPITEALKRENGPLDVIRKDFHTIQNKLTIREKGWRAVKDKLAWTFSKTEVNEICARLERQKSTLSLALEAEHT